MSDIRGPVAAADAQDKAPAQRLGVRVEIGGLYLEGDRLVSLLTALPSGHVRIRDEVTGEESTISPGRLRPRPIDTDQAYTPASVDLSDDEKEGALKKQKALGSLIRTEKWHRTQAMIVAAARRASRAPRTIRRWLKDLDTGGLRALAPLKRGRPRGGVGIDPRVETIIIETIREKLRSEPGITVRNLLPAIRTACDKLNAALPLGRQVRYPGEATIGRRLRLERKNHENHRGETRAFLRELKRATPGSVKTVRPLQRVEIDHTVMDVHAVDDNTLESIGRPWVTIAIDVFSRCILAFVLLMVRPSHLSVALCVQRIRYPKISWLQSIESPVEWDMWGAPEVLHCDNAKEFKHRGLEYGCAEMRTRLEYRPPAVPRYGGTIERSVGTLGREARLLTGATHNDLLKKATSKPVHSAAFTVKHLEWEMARIVAKYHDTPHRGLNGMTPRKKWLQGLQQQGMIAPELPSVPEDLFIVDFLPWIPRNVSRQGVQLEGRFYWDDALRPFVNSGHKVVARPDLRTVRKLALLLPDSSRYVHAEMIKPTEFNGITQADWRVFKAANKCELSNHQFHAELERESDSRRADAEARVRARRRAAKTELSTRGLISQNERFREEAKKGGEANLQPVRKPAPGQIDLAKLEPTRPYVYRPKSPYT